MTIDYRLDIPKIMINIYISMVIFFQHWMVQKKSWGDFVSPKKKDSGYNAMKGFGFIVCPELQKDFGLNRKVVIWGDKKQM